MKSKGKRVHEFYRFKTGLFNTNIWKSDYYILPPCEYYTFKYNEQPSPTNYAKYDRYRICIGI